MLGQELKPSGPIPQLLINNKVLWVQCDSFRRPGVPGSPHGLFRRGVDALVTVYYSPYLGHEPSVQRIFTFCTETAKNKHEVT